MNTEKHLTLADRIGFMVADGRNMGVNEQTIDLDVLEHAEAALSPQADKARGDGLDYVPGELDRTAPARIWLQIDTSGDNAERDEAWPGADHVTWQDEEIGGLEIAYVRADLATPQPQGDASGQVSGGGEVEIDPQLAAFYQVTTVAGLLAAQEEHIQKLQDTVRRNVKPWEDTFPSTLLPKYMRDTGLLDGEARAALAAELRRIDNISAAIGGTPEIAQMYRDACVEFVSHPALLAMLASQENKA